MCGVGKRLNFTTQQRLLYSPIMASSSSVRETRRREAPTKSAAKKVEEATSARTAVLVWKRMLMIVNVMDDPALCFGFFLEGSFSRGGC